MQKKGQLAFLNSVAMYEVQLTHKSLSRQAAFCWSVRQIHMTNLKIDEILSGEIFHPHAELQTSRILIRMTGFCQRNFAEK